MTFENGPVNSMGGPSQYYGRPQSLVWAAPVISMATSSHDNGRRMVAEDGVWGDYLGEPTLTRPPSVPEGDSGGMVLAWRRRAGRSRGAEQGAACPDR